MAGPRSTKRLRGAGTLGGRGGRSAPPGVPANLLAPMVRRAVLTGRGPAGLLLWLRGQVGACPVREPTERFVLALTADLLRAMRDPRGARPDRRSHG